MNRVIIVTGSCGHLGNMVVKELLRRGETVRGLVRSGSKVEIFNSYDLELYTGDICDYESLEEIFDTPEGREVVVIHTAGMVSTTSENKGLIKKVNVEGTANIIKRCLHHGVKRLIYISSVHAIEEPVDRGIISESDKFNPKKVAGLYAKTKAEASQLVIESLEKGLNSVLIYPSGIIGPGDYGAGHTTQLVKDYLEGRLKATVRGGYDFVDVRDVASGIVSAIDNGECGKGYILSGHYITVKELTSMLAKITGKKKIRHVIPIIIAKITAPLSELYYRIRGQKPLYSRYSLLTLNSNSNFSNKRAEVELGFKARDIEESMKDMVNWVLKNES